MKYVVVGLGLAVAPPSFHPSLHPSPRSLFRAVEEKWMSFWLQEKVEERLTFFWASQVPATAAALPVALKSCCA